MDVIPNGSVVASLALCSYVLCQELSHLSHVSQGFLRETSEAKMIHKVDVNNLKLCLAYKSWISIWTKTFFIKVFKEKRLIGLTLKKREDQMEALSSELYTLTVWQKKKFILSLFLFTVFILFYRLVF